MVDIGHRQTDEVLERLEKCLAEEYAQAYKDVEKKAADYFKRFEVKDKQKKALVDAGKLSEKDYQTWRRNQMLSGKRWTDLRDQLAKDLTNVNQIAAGIVRGELNEVFAINANYSEYMIENGMRTNYGFTLYDRNTIANLVANDPDIIPWKPEVDVKADLRWNRQMITSHITQGILQGESIPNLSKRLLKTVNNDKVAAVRTARTAVTSSQNAGRQMVYDRAKRMGLKLQKSWMATLDARTRHEHGAVDGQRVPLDGQFTVGGYKMKFPGDMSAPAHLVYNCRCTTITVEPDYITKGEEPRMTYSEWVESKEGKEAIQKKKDAEKKARQAKKDKQGKETGKKKEEKKFKPVETETSAKLKEQKVAYKEVADRKGSLTDSEIIDILAGGDMTTGSCASAALAYCGQKQGWEVLDFRGGESRAFFSGKLAKLNMFEELGADIIVSDSAKTSLTNAKNALKKLEVGKEYYFSAGRHAAIVRNNNGVLQYLELQSRYRNGWMDFEDGWGKTADKLKSRFGCSSSSQYFSDVYATDISTLKGDKFRTILGYINTDENSQKKGGAGGVK